jgi:hypothetical protein
MRLFEPDDYEVIREWFTLRKMGAPLLSDLPSTGFIVDFCAAGFIIETNCSTAILDFFISNPECSAEQRSKALNQITQNLLDLAKRKKYRGVLASTKLSAIENRAYQNRFKSLGAFKMFYKGLQ